MKIYKSKPRIEVRPLYCLYYSWNSKENFISYSEEIYFTIWFPIYRSKNIFTNNIHFAGDWFAARSHEKI